MKRFKQISILSISLSLVTGTISPQAANAGGYARGQRYGKTEMDKAVGKCAGALFFGGVAGAIGGAILGGGKSTRRGLAIGLGAGAVGCVVIMANAKRADRIIAAQIAAASNRDGYYSTSFRDDKGAPVDLVARAGPSQTIDASRLTPVRYNVENTSFAAPALDTGGHECRLVDGTLRSRSGIGATPSQYVCRTASGDWLPYELSRNRT